MSTPHCVIRGGLEGRERLRVLARVMAPTTNELFARVGVEPSARCLDVGCGGGDVALALADLVPQGLVVGIDVDETKLTLPRRRPPARTCAYRVSDLALADGRASPSDIDCPVHRRSQSVPLQDTP